MGLSCKCNKKYKPKKKKQLPKGQKSTKPFGYDDTMEKFDDFSNLDVGTTFDSFFRGEDVGFNERKPENYVFIVDLDSFEYHKIGFHSFLGEILQSVFFRYAILGLVLFNSILIGMNTHKLTVSKYKKLLQTADQVILSIFIFEILMKWMYDFRLFWAVWWNVLDFLIVFLIITASVVPLFGSRKEIFAMIRVVRAFRILRSVSSLTSLNVVTHTIVKSIADMVNILFVLILFMFVMAIAGVTLFDVPELDTTRFHNTFDAWFVIFICVTQDGWNQLLDEFRPDEGEDPGYFIMVSVYLMIAVAVGAFVFTNLIVAVVVANLELAMKELRAEKQLKDNPLEFHGEFSAHVLEVISVYRILSHQNKPLLAQRPMKVPDIRSISPRRLQAYISLVVALEQNMLEFVIIERDFQKVMSVILTIVKQLERDEPDVEEEMKAGRAALQNLDLAKQLILSSALDK